MRSAAARKYSHLLTTSKTFFQLCDGVRTVARLDVDGYFVGIAQLGDGTTASPLDTTADRFTAHAAATRDGTSICAVLTSHGDIRVFANGAELFTFARGRWQLRDVGWKWAIAEERIGSGPIARALLGASINLAERRRGGLFVVIDDRADVDRLVNEGDRLDLPSPALGEKTSKQSFHYLLRGSNVLTLPSPVLETVAAIDGAVVLSRDGGIIDVAAILRNDPATRSIEGARTAAAIAASRFGTALMISEDGVISLVAERHVVWTL
jgi:DNA integrity scanning protein DisA with diadenylate cyclase activity